MKVIGLGQGHRAVVVPVGIGHRADGHWVR